MPDTFPILDNLVRGLNPAGCIICTMPNLRDWFGMLATLAGLILLLWGLWPWSNEARHLEVIMPEGEIQIESPGVSGASEIASAASQLDFEWPGRLRTGDSGWVRLRLTFPKQDGISEWWGEARMELPGLASQPPEEMLVPHVPGKPLDFAWRVQAAQPGLSAVTPGFSWKFEMMPGRRLPGTRSRPNGLRCA